MRGAGELGREAALSHPGGNGAHGETEKKRRCLYLSYTFCHLPHPLALLFVFLLLLIVLAWLFVSPFAKDWKFLVLNGRE